MNLTILGVEKGNLTFRYYKIKNQYLQETEVKYIFFTSNDFEYLLRVSLFNGEWFATNVYHHHLKNEICPHCQLKSFSTVICESLEKEKEELFQNLLNLKQYRLQGLFDFS